MNKVTLRKYLSGLRANLSQGEYAERNEACLQLLKEELGKYEFKVIHIFLPIEKNREPNTKEIISWLAKERPEVKILVPKADFENHRLINYVFDSELKLKENKWGIPEPEDGIIVESKNIDLVLLPLLGFDLQGHRLGYGKGFYDRFLSLDCRKDAVKIGLSLLAPLEKFPFSESHDVAMDACVTPWKTYYFG